MEIMGADSSETLDRLSSVLHWRASSVMRDHWEVSKYPASTDPLVCALQALLRREGGHVTVGDKANVSDQSLYQIAFCKPDSGTKKPKSVGPSIRRRLTATFPDWLDGDTASSTAPFSDPVLSHMAALDPTARRRAENVLRAHFGFDPLPMQGAVALPIDTPGKRQGSGA